MDGALRIIDRGMIVDAARHALTLHQWITAPDFDQEGEVQAAERELDRPSAITAPLLSAAFGMHAWLSKAAHERRSGRRWSATGCGTACCARRFRSPGLEPSAPICRSSRRRGFRSS
jgi:hypothetical protein